MGCLFCYKGGNMAKKFNVRITKRLKDIIFVSQFDDYGEILGMLLSYPDITDAHNKFTPKFFCEIKAELDRQYACWEWNNKGE